MYREDLYNKVLIEPLKNFQVDELYVVSGYASATFVKQHLDHTKSLNNPRINLIIGMPRKINDHIAFVELHKKFADRFKGYYLETHPPVHSKIYSWCNKSIGVLGFSGSSNYSQAGFLESTPQINQMKDDDPTEIKSFFYELLQRSTYMPEAKDVSVNNITIPSLGLIINAGEAEWVEENKSARISFLNKRTGNLPTRSGLNWGQREVRQNKDEAYLSIKVPITKEGFLPEKGSRFSLITDDNKSFDCVVAQDGRKSIETTDDNSLLGKYIRKRIGVQLGTLVTKQDLENYGRTDFSIMKLDDETFMFDFSV